MKLSRQQRRAKARALAKGKDIKAEVADMYHQAAAKAFDITAEEREAALKEMQSDTIGQMMVLIIAYMRIKKHHQGKWLVDFTKDFNEFCNDMMLDKVKVDDLFQMLKEETDVDFEKLFLKISDEEEERIAKRKRR